MKQNIEKQIKDLAARYADCGIDEAIIRKMMDDEDNPSGLDDLTHITGESREEVMKSIQEAGVTPISVSVAPWLVGG